ncbi:hypothetical protein CYG48_05125 [Neorhizobium sp. SOG26]|uniref:hypothetical protein n=1 Tax=Neorhizobium sp. SOG26 TaxID=2060726 RepID=UPI000E57E5A9|nr:hypothetical protein [Neorhizobium sp. SOG26]AXV15136.1 hypothetical protein CYG48_05125 [Neorhizobium sp. SOG26]
MSLFHWRKKPDHREIEHIEAEKKELKAELALSVMQFERRRSTVEEIADNVMAYMHQKGGRN